MLFWCLCDSQPVFLSALVNVASAQTRQYFFVSMQLNWTEAQSFCRSNYTDLATIENIADVSAVFNTSHYNGNWRWSLNDSSFYGEGETEFRNWARSQPNNLNDLQYCVMLYATNGLWYDYYCSRQQPFVCYNVVLRAKNKYLFIYVYD
uniref:C-type lectin domain-containing protein n=1 Tax=Mola mola TaxID=94237 RepID=A0A3Q3X0W9_MOLML